MIDNIYICDRCAKEHRGAKPFGWQTGVQINMTANGLPTYSPYHIDRDFDHLCEECAGEVSTAITKALEPSK